MRIPSKLQTFYHQLDEVDKSRQLSSLLRSYAVVKYSNEIPNISLLDGLKELLSLSIQLLKGLFWSASSIRFKEGIPILTFMSKRPHLYKMNALLSTEFADECNHAYFFKPQSLIGDCSNAVVLAGLPHKVLSREVITNRKLIRQARKLFLNYLREEGLSAKHMIPFWVHTIRQYAALGSFRKLFKNQKFSGLVCEYDQYNQLAAFMIAAKEVAIPTYTQIHGLLNEQFAYTPLIANKIFAWGNYHKRKLLDWGTPEKQVLITGATQYHPYPNLDSGSRKRILQKFNLANGVIVVATNPMKNQIREALIEFVDKIASGLTIHWSLIVRPHPSESMDQYKAALEGHANTYVMNNANMDMATLMQIADIALVWNSAFAIDTLVNRIRTIQMKLNFSDTGEVSKMVNLGLIPSFQEPNEVSDYLVAPMEGERSSPIAISDAEYAAFKAEYCNNFGSDAAKRMHHYITTEQKD